MTITKVDHVTYEVPIGFLTDNSLYEFFKLLGMQEIKPDQEVEKGWNVRWFQDVDGFQIHLVEGKLDRQVCEPPVDLKLGHFCAILSRQGYRDALDSIYVERNSAKSPRAWLRHAGTGLRVEIRPQSPEMDTGEAIEAGVSMLRAAEEMGADRFEKLEYVKWNRNTADKIKAVLEEAQKKFVSRNKEHKDSWKREGIKGCVYNVRRKAERAWDVLWNADHDVDEEFKDFPSRDDLIDLINYSALTILAVEYKEQGDWWS